MRNLVYFSSFSLLTFLILSLFLGFIFSFSLPQSLFFWISSAISLFLVRFLPTNLVFLSIVSFFLLTFLSHPHTSLPLFLASFLFPSINLSSVVLPISFSPLSLPLCKFSFPDFPSFLSLLTFYLIQADILLPIFPSLSLCPVSFPLLKFSFLLSLSSNFFLLIRLISSLSFQSKCQLKRFSQMINLPLK